MGEKKKLKNKGALERSFWNYFASIVVTSPPHKGLKRRLRILSMTLMFCFKSRIRSH